MSRTPLTGGYAGRMATAEGRRLAQLDAIRRSAARHENGPADARASTGPSSAPKHARDPEDSAGKLGAHR